MGDSGLPESARAIAAELRGLLAVHKVTPSDVAERLGVDRRTVIRRLSGEQSLDLADISTVARMLGFGDLDLIVLLAQRAQGTVARTITVEHQGIGTIGVVAGDVKIEQA